MFGPTYAQRTLLTFVLALAITPVTGNASRDDDDDGGEMPFAEAEIFFELNDTDGDLGIQAEIDGDAWKRLEIEDPRGRRMLDLRVQGRLRRQGLTQIAFESAEPTFDVLPPEVFFRRFPKGIYEIEGKKLDGGELESEAELTHVIPASPENLEFSGEPAPEDCDADLPVISTPVDVTWDPVTTSHPELGDPTDALEVISQELVAADEETEEVGLSVLLPPGETSFRLPPSLTELIGSGETVKFEILVREASGNRTALETCFVLE